MQTIECLANQIKQTLLLSQSDEIYQKWFEDYVNWCNSKGLNVETFMLKTHFWHIFMNFRCSIPL
jgi:hypothetical protein